MLALLAKLSQTHFYWMLDTRTELFSHVQIFKDKVSRYDKKKVLDLAISGSHFCFFQMT